MADDTEFCPCDTCKTKQVHMWCLDCFNGLRELLKQYELYPFDDKAWKAYRERFMRNDPQVYESNQYIAFTFWQAEQDRQPRKRVFWNIPEHMDEVWQRDAMVYVRKAIARGVLPNLREGGHACVDCGAVATLWEHRSYTRPLDVEPVCRPCNAKRGTAHWPSAADYNFTRITEHA